MRYSQLLLSRDALTKANAKLSFGNGTLEMFGKVIKLETTRAGHYKIPLLENNTMFDVMFSVNDLKSAPIAEKRKIAFKLHRQFGHADKKRICDLLHDANVHDSDLGKLLGDMKKTCEVCARYKRCQSRPVVKTSMTQ